MSAWDELARLTKRRAALEGEIARLVETLQRRAQDAYRRRWKRGEIPWAKICLPVESPGTEHAMLRAHRPVEALCLVCDHPIGRAAHCSGSQGFTERHVGDLHVNLAPYVYVHRACVPAEILARQED